MDRHLRLLPECLEGATASQLVKHGPKLESVEPAVVPDEVALVRLEVLADLGVSQLNKHFVGPINLTVLHRCQA